ncbi:hypothetical protein D3C87_1080840 [compost metagenome]
MIWIVFYGCDFSVYLDGVILLQDSLFCLFLVIYWLFFHKVNLVVLQMKRFYQL